MKHFHLIVRCVYYCRMSSSNRKKFSIEEKAVIVQRLESGEKNSTLAKEFGVSHSTISTIFKNAGRIRQVFESNSLKIKRLRPSKFPQVEEALLKWFKKQRTQNLPISGPLLQEQANILAVALGVQGFKASESWIFRFRQRHNIVLGKISGEAAAVSQSVCDDWLQSVWPKLRMGYKNCEIYNADETGLFYKLTPDKMLKFKGEKCIGGKLSKERITVLVATNMDGSDKRKLLVIGKSKNPRCFKKIKSLPVDYEANLKAWMTGTIFEKTLLKWDNELRAKKKNILLLVDNCPSHLHIETLSSIKLVFLPPNVTSVLQPVDQGIIKNLKHHYRKILVMKMIRNAELKIQTQISLLNAIEIVSAAWNRVSEETIRNCFRHAGFDSVNETARNPDDDFDEDDELPLLEWNKIYGENNMINWDEFVTLDQNVVTEEEQTTEDIVHEVLENPEEQETDLEDDLEFTPPTAAEALLAVETIKRFAQFSMPDEKLFQTLSDVERRIEISYLKKKKQTTILDYFKK